MSVEYRVLGPVAAFTEGSPVKLGGKTPRMILALLLANADHVVSQDTLLDAIWGNDADRATRSLHTYISTLRRLLGGSIERRDHGYVLKVGANHLDWIEFERHLAMSEEKKATDPVNGRDLLVGALALWHGPAFGDLGNEPALAGYASRLSQIRLRALESRFELDLELGLASGIIPEIESLLTEEPYREHLVALLMLALYRSGRQTEALRVCQQTRQRLADELGIDISGELEDLEIRILNHDASLEAASTRLPPSPHRGARGYELHETFGRTRFGTIHRGFHSVLGREVAVHVIDQELASNPTFVRRFEVEVQAASRLSHPHLTPILDFWRDASQTCVVTPFLGPPVSDGMRHSGLETLVRMVAELSSAIGHLHRSGMSHGSITTESVFVDQERNFYLGDTGLEPAARVGGSQLSPADDIRQLGELFSNAMETEELEPSLPIEARHAVERALHDQPKRRYKRVEDFSRALKQSLGLDLVMAAEPFEVHDPPNPYKGLRAFQEHDAADFHGRDSLISKILAALSSTELVTVVGASGSGKSSVVRAGLIPALRRGALPGSESWLFTDMYPGERPFDSLRLCLSRVSLNQSDLGVALESGPTGLLDAIDSMRGGDPLLIVIDQLEELFSLVSGDTRRRFLEMLVETTRYRNGGIKLVTTLRADFFDKPLEFGDFAEVFIDGVVAVTPPSRDGLGRAIIEPASRVGVGVEPGLVTRLVDDVHDQPGGLPLLQFSLTELFDKSSGGTMTLAGYEAIGGVGGALAARAETTYGNLSDEGKEAARQLFLRLVSVDEMAEDTRRRIRQSEIMGLIGDETVMSDVLQRFGAARFLAFDRDAVSRTPTVEITHEALLSEWSRLRMWIDERREDLLIHRRVQVAVNDWLHNDRNAGYLLGGGFLQRVTEWMERTDIAVTAEESELIEASIHEEESEAAERFALESRAAKRRRAVIYSLTAAFLAAAVIGVYALVQRGTALSNAVAARIGELTQAAEAITADDPELAVLLAAEAVGLAIGEGSRPPAEALGALWSAHVDQRLRARYEDIGAQAISFSPDGTHVAVDSPFGGDGVARLIDPETGTTVRALRSDLGDTGLEVLTIEHSNDGSLVAIGRGGFHREDAIVEVFSTDTGERLNRLSGELEGVGTVHFTHEGNLVTAEITDDESEWALVIWDPLTGDELGRFRDLEQAVGGAIRVAGVAPDPAAGELVIGVVHPDQEHFLATVDLTTGELERRVPIALAPYGVESSPDGRLVAVSDEAEQTVMVYDFDTGEAILGPISHQVPQSLEWSADGERLAIGGNESDVTIVDITSGVVSSLSGHQASVWGIVFHPSQEQVVSLAVDGELRLWDISAQGGAAGSVDTGGVDVSTLAAGQENLVISITREGVRVVDASTGSIRSAQSAVVEVPTFAAVADRVPWYAAIGQDGNPFIMNADGDRVQGLPRCSAPRALSPEGRYVVLDSRLQVPSLLDACEGERGVSGIVDTVTGEKLVDFGDSHVRYGAFTASTEFDGRQYVAVTVSNDDYVVEVWRLDPAERMGVIDRSMVGDLYHLLMSTSPSGRYLGIGMNGPRAVVVDLQSLSSRGPVEDAIVFNREAHTSNAPLTLVTDSGLVASSGFDGFYRWWELETGELVFEIEVDGLRGHPAHDFSPDGSYYFYEDGDGVIRRVPTDPQRMLELALGSVTRDFTDDECARYLKVADCMATGGVSRNE